MLMHYRIKESRKASSSMPSLDFPFRPPLSRKWAERIFLFGPDRAQDIAKLKGAGYSTIVGVQQATRKTLTKIKVSSTFRLS